VSSFLSAGSRCKRLILSFQVVGKAPGGGDLVVGGGDGGVVPPEAMRGDPKAGVANQKLPGTGQPGVNAPGVGEVGFGNSAPPAYSSGLGEPLGTQGLGHDSKR